MLRLMVRLLWLLLLLLQLQLLLARWLVWVLLAIFNFVILGVFKGV